MKTNLTRKTTVTVTRHPNEPGSVYLTWREEADGAIKHCGTIAVSPGFWKLLRPMLDGMDGVEIIPP